MFFEEAECGVRADYAAKVFNVVRHFLRFRRRLPWTNWLTKLKKCYTMALIVAECAWRSGIPI